MTNQLGAGTGGMSAYERRRWAELEEHWAKAGERRPILPAKVRQALAALADSSPTSGDVRPKALQLLHPSRSRTRPRRP